MWVGGAVGAGTAIGCAFIFVGGSRIVLHPFSGLELGSNGMAIRFLYDPAGQTSIAWDALGSAPRLSTDFDRVFIQVPIIGVLAIALGVVTVGIWMARRDPPAGDPDQEGE